jgi:hypothetical protein
MPRFCGVGVKIVMQFMWYGGKRLRVPSSMYRLRPQLMCHRQCDLPATTVSRRTSNAGGFRVRSLLMATSRPDLFAVVDKQRFPEWATNETYSSAYDGYSPK